MRKELGVLLMEDDKGEVAVQLVAELPSVEGAFHNLTGKVGDKSSRATLISLKYRENGIVSEVISRTKLLPVVVPVEDKPDGFVLGSGPVNFEKPKE